MLPNECSRHLQARCNRCSVRSRAKKSDRTSAHLDRPKSNRPFDSALAEIFSGKDLSVKFQSCLEHFGIARLPRTSVARTLGIGHHFAGVRSGRSPPRRTPSRPDNRTIPRCVSHCRCAEMILPLQSPLSTSKPGTRLRDRCSRARIDPVRPSRP